MMKTVELGSNLEHPEVARLLERRPLGDPEVLDAVGMIVTAVKDRGDEALLEYTRRFDGADLQRLGLGLALAPEEVERAQSEAPADFMEALRFAAQRIRDFHEREVAASWFSEDDGELAGQLIRPIKRVGLYVPGGRASYPSTVLMTAIPAKVAGVSEIAVCVPPDEDGAVSSHTLAACGLLGVTEVYRLGGAQAIAAMAYGTASVRRVDKIAGPGNAYVTLAKKMVVGEVGIDMLAGPSEVVVIVDSDADASFAAADLLAQAEHDPEATAILISTCHQKMGEVLSEVERQMADLPTRVTAQKSLAGRGMAFKVDDMPTALELADRLAPEHLELLVNDAQQYLDHVGAAGAIFLGPYSAEVLGDYSAGPDHVLPTSGTARFSSVLSVADFVTRTSVLSFSKEAAVPVARAAAKLAEAEGLPAHARAARLRQSVSGTD